jgi:hypothetical protein
MIKGRPEKPDHHPDDGSGRIEFTALFTGRIREFAYEVFICGTQKIGEFEILIA